MIMDNIVIDANALKEKKFGPIPVVEGGEYEVLVESLGDKGDGIAKVQGFVIIIPGALKGNLVRVRVTAIRGRVSFGEVVYIIQDNINDPTFVPRFGDTELVSNKKILKRKGEE